MQKNDMEAFEKALLGIILKVSVKNKGRRASLEFFTFGDVDKYYYKGDLESVLKRFVDIFEKEKMGSEGLRIFVFDDDKGFDVFIDNGIDEYPFTIRFLAGLEDWYKKARRVKYSRRVFSPDFRFIVSLPFK